VKALGAGRGFAFDHRVLLLGILLAALALRLALVLYVSPYPERFIRTDAVGYDQIALNLLAGHGFSRRAMAPFVPDNFRTPIYPWTIALCYALFGYRPEIVLVLQSLLGAATCLAVYVIAKQVHGTKAGLAAATLLAVSPISIAYAAVLWSDTEYTFLLTLALLLTVAMFTRPEFKWPWWSGLMAGVATLAHPRSLYLPGLLAAVLLLNRLRQRWPVGRAALAAGSYLAAFALALAPWAARNYLTFGVPNVTSAAGINLLDYGAALAEASQTGENQWAIVARYEAEVLAGSPTYLNAAQFSEAAARLALIKIAQRPTAYAKVHLSGMARTLLPVTTTINQLLTGQDNLETASIYGAFVTDSVAHPQAYLQALREIPLDVWGIIGFELLSLVGIYSLTMCALMVRGPWSPWAWLLTAILVYLVAVAGPAGAPRFRVAMMPTFSVLAALGLAAVRPLIARAGADRGRDLRLKVRHS
jgi:4-amino-4-deoxy-L-arabinose transferase-like glycosyltransferase